MTVIITFAGISGGDSLSDTIDITNGEIMSPEDSTDVQDIFIRHDAEVAPITNCGFYLTRFAGSGYGGDADLDYDEIITWGKDIAGKGAKICQIPGFNFEADGLTFDLGNGTIESPFVLDDDAIIQGIAEDGKIYVSGEAHIQFRIDTPQVSDITRGAGYRAVSLVFVYSATS